MEVERTCTKHYLTDLSGVGLGEQLNMIIVSHWYMGAVDVLPSEPYLLITVDLTAQTSEQWYSS